MKEGAETLPLSSTWVRTWTVGLAAVKAAGLAEHSCLQRAPLGAGIPPGTSVLRKVKGLFYLR